MTDYIEVVNVVQNIFIGADERDWQMVHASFAPRVLLDYTSMTGGKPTELVPEQIIDAWKALLPGFQATQHQLGNFKTVVQENKADVFCYGTATHYLPNPSNQNVWTVVGTYLFQLIKKDNEWKVSRMKFNFKYQDGNLELPKLATEKVK
ncbi:nuclear transport factor 2 family protein [Xanthocytophaga agilis]|uniref:Nuclear transport factor 2 family protein n=1 Tax=Xanthocytophaga agilis TaxID=3048010 RepID=A0AAE3UDY8_9BACT|nr:nuclear transport factor 2 family protein [Xanthocytophaga agilis]MDJ1499712.1 nuclear transport factor 2 family protein [Xanthocytophaga agilis]